MQQFAILGGTFDPIHWGHLLMAETALDQLGLDQVIWVPSGYPPHRKSSAVLDIHHRLEMVQRAIAPHPSFRLSRVDQERSGPSYAIYTFLDLQAAHPSSQWYWIIGLDAFASLPRWYRGSELATHCHWLVAPRPSYQEQCLDICQGVAAQMAEQNVCLHWQPLRMPPVQLSAGLIRQYCGDRRSIRYLVPDVVRDYIHRHNLYQE